LVFDRVLIEVDKIFVEDRDLQEGKNLFGELTLLIVQKLLLIESLNKAHKGHRVVDKDLLEDKNPLEDKKVFE